MTRVNNSDGVSSFEFGDDETKDVARKTAKPQLATPSATDTCDLACRTGRQRGTTDSVGVGVAGAGGVGAARDAAVGKLSKRFVEVGSALFERRTMLLALNRNFPEMGEVKNTLQEEGGALKLEKDVRKLKNEFLELAEQLDKYGVEVPKTLLLAATQTYKVEKHVIPDAIPNVGKAAETIKSGAKWAGRLAAAGSQIEKATKMLGHFAGFVGSVGKFAEAANIVGERDLAKAVEKGLRSLGYLKGELKQPELANGEFRTGGFWQAVRELNLGWKETMRKKLGPLAPFVSDIPGLSQVADGEQIVRTVIKKLETGTRTVPRPSALFIRGEL